MIEREKLTPVCTDEQGPGTLWKRERDVVEGGLPGTLGDKREALDGDEGHG